ncbi:MAG: hypothetical protein PGN25_15415 [Methylorubrum populi]
MLGSLFVLGPILAVGGCLLMEAHTVMHDRAADALDGSMRRLRAGLEPGAEDAGSESEAAAQVLAPAAELSRQAARAASSDCPVETTNAD